jgi:hypothetical protein
MALTKFKIGTLERDKLWLETFPTLSQLTEEVLLRARLEYLGTGPKFNKLFSGNVDGLTIDQITVWFNGKQGFDAAMLHGDNAEWILITRETS